MHATDTQPRTRPRMIVRKKKGKVLRIMEEGATMARETITTTIRISTSVGIRRETQS